MKKYFYVIRPLLAAKWILDRRTSPPMLFDDLVEAELDTSLRPELDRLLEMKKTMPEMGQAPRIENFNKYIENIMPEMKQLADHEEDITVEWAPLDEVFLNVLQMNMHEE